MSSARCPTASVIRVTPAATSWRTTISRIGISPTGTNGFGNAVVYGANRVPLPPAKITARKGVALYRVLVGQVELRVVRDPADCPGEPLVEAHCRRPPQMLARLPGIGAESQDFRARRADPFG